MAGAALYRNTLVCLPTGLGKTFIAAVLMYNFYRWFPDGKVVFTAPTKALVAQQRDACARLMAIPRAHMARLTGSTQAHIRKDIWTSKRVLFLTPQVMVNDLSRGACPAVKIKCLVIDEAHKALGNYAYCQVVRELTKYTNHFRILALSATPGSDTKAVQQVVSNLLIGQIELRSEDSPDIIPYSHERRVEKLVVPLGEDLAAIQDAYIQVLEAFASPLIRMNILMRRDIPNLTKYQIILARDQFRKNPSPQMVGIQQGIVEGQLALCISLYHGFELLQQMGLRSFYMFLRGIMDGTKGLARARNELGRNENFMKLYRHLESMFPDSGTHSGSSTGISATRIGHEDRKVFYSHPKLKKLEEVVVEHFRTWKDQRVSESNCDGTRVMIFSSFRDSVQEIADMLHQHHPIIRAMTFVGQGSGKNVKGFTQKEQLEVVRQFRDGGYNTLVSTCVGEEGLDIGEVDLIVCFDAQKSPIRLVQRMGRTGRKRQGRIVVILSEGREERMYNQSQANRKSIYKAIAGNSKALHFYQGSPRMVPDGINPKLHKMFITPETPESAKPSRTLPRKSSLSSCGGKQRNLKEGWCLSEEEFEIWNQRYRLKESDQIQEIIFPQGRFASLQDEKEIPQQNPRAGTRELSLFEWRVWQNRPFPTHLVDHSERCYHFISIMETIELMRHEEGECSYDLEIKPYLQMEDVTFPASDLRRSCALPISGPAKPQREGIGEPSSPFIGSADGQTSLSEPPAGLRASGTPQPGRRTILAEVEKAQPTEENTDGGVKSSITPVRSPAEHSLRGGLQEGKMEPTAEQMTVQGEASEKAETLAGGRSCEGHFSMTSKCADSGYNSFAGENSSASSSMFYPPEEELFSAGAAAEFYQGGHSLTQEMLANVERFLSRSPPPLSESSDFEDGGLQVLALQSNPSFPSAEQFQNGSPIHLGAHSTIHTQLSWELKLPQNSQLSKPNLSSDALHDRPSWDDIFECDDEANVDVEGEDLEVENHIQTNSVSPKTLNGERHNGACGSHVEGLEIDQDSIRLFEDADDEFHNKSPSHLSSSCRILLTPDRAAAEEVPLAFHSPFSNEQIEGNDSESRNPLENNPEIRESSENFWGENESKLQNGEAYDNSKELFSITFDLGFCLPDSDDEILEQAADVDPIDVEKPNYLSGSPADCKNMKGTDFKLSKASSPWGHNGSETQTVFSTPLTLQNHRRGSEKRSKPFDPEFSPLSEAKEREFGSPDNAVAATSFSSLGVEKMGSTPSCRPDAMNSSSKTGQKVLQTPATHRHRVNPRSIKKVLNSAFENPGLGTEKVKSNTHVRLHEAGPFIVKGSSSESDDDVAFQRKSEKKKRDVLQSPEGSNKSDVDSPLHVVKKRRRPLNTSESSSDESADFQKPARPQNRNFKSDNKHFRSGARAEKNHLHLKSAGRQFLDEEAELSQGDGDTVSSDESDDSENEQDPMLLEFLNDGTQLSQVLNDSEMEGVYLKSVRSPWMSNKYKMVHKRRDVTTIFSQIPEQDEAYVEDSFCVEEEEEALCKSDSGEEICVDFNLLNEECFTGIRKKYQTRRAVKLKQARELPRKKLSRIIVIDDSSEEEDNASDKPESNATAGPNSSKKELQGDCSASRLPPGPSMEPQANTSQSGAPQSLTHKPNPLGLKAAVSEVVDFQPDHRDDVICALPAAVTADSGRDGGRRSGKLKGDGSLKAVEPYTSALCGSLPEERSGRPDVAMDQRKQTCILVDCREISSGSEIISSLKAVHKLDVEVCSLSGCDYIVSNRMVVERKSLSELLNSLNRTKLVERIQHLQSKFERICVIVEKDREKTGDTSRLFHRTKSYDSLLAALISAGIRILFSSCQEETADLLKELALVEQRKNVGIQVPTAVTGSRQGILQFYLTIPNISYVTALNMCHHFPCVKKMANSSLEAIAFCAQVTQQKAEEIYHYIHYAFDEQMLPDNPNHGKAKPRLQ
ncbi:Fanconi anemia group M protein [Tachyglossus aculeatus]|uniref:Fanconi anemia group M protein n=1 Tax=Tachyglossus aculeatus TaxID=9261 RepID=UPI0018F67C0B|nr:Fanconi anemia group M protein [Tachyglossus aculeatus]